MSDDQSIYELLAEMRDREEDELDGYSSAFHSMLGYFEYWEANPKLRMLPADARAVMQQAYDDAVAGKCRRRAATADHGAPNHDSRDCFKCL